MTEPTQWLDLKLEEGTGEPLPLDEVDRANNRLFLSDLKAVEELHVSIMDEGLFEHFSGYFSTAAASKERLSSVVITHPLGQRLRIDWEKKVIVFSELDDNGNETDLATIDCSDKWPAL